MNKAVVFAAIAKVRKAIVAAGATALLVFLHNHGIEVDNDTLAVLLDASIVSGITWLVPNSKPLFEKDGDNDDPKVH